MINWYRKKRIIIKSKYNNIIYLYINIKSTVRIHLRLTILLKKKMKNIESFERFYNYCKVNDYYYRIVARNASYFCCKLSIDSTFFDCFGARIPSHNTRVHQLRIFSDNCCLAFTERPEILKTCSYSVRTQRLPLIKSKVTVSPCRWESIFFWKASANTLKVSQSRESDKKEPSKWGWATFPEDETENYIFRTEEMEMTSISAA